MVIVGGVLQLFSQQDMKEYDKAMYYFDNGGEVYFTFAVDKMSQLGKLSEIISIDNSNGGNIVAYANREEFNNFLELGLYYEVLTHPGDLFENSSMASSLDEIREDWDKYPTFDQYKEMMYKFEQDYPDLCKIIEIGKSVKGREILYAKISDNISETEAEPRHMYTSTMHGDEVTMFVNLLRLIDYLLTKYNSDSYVKKLVDNVEIWICPNENPDGTYQNDNSTIQGARRENANGIDLNRHYPRSGLQRNRASTAKEPECQAVLDLLEEYDFVLSANCHGGAELLNYPYDFGDVRHADDKWMEYVYSKFADQVHDENPDHLTGGNNGIIRGYKWYEIQGSRMDYVTYFKRMREVTFEASSSKAPSGSTLHEYWNCYYQACLEYIEQNLFGINGMVTCAVGDTGIRAKVYVKSHDNEQSYVFSEKPHGDFWRPILAGTYEVEFTCNGYQSHTEKNVSVKNDEATVLNIKLWPDGTGINYDQKINNADIIITPYTREFVKITFSVNPGNIKAGVFDISGRLIRSLYTKGNTCILWDGSDDSGSQVPNGCYVLRVSGGGNTMTKNFVVSR